MAQKMTAKENRIFEAGRRLGYALGYTCGWHRALAQEEEVKSYGIPKQRRPWARLAGGKARLRHRDVAMAGYNTGRTQDKLFIGHMLKGRRP